MDILHYLWHMQHALRCVRPTKSKSMPTMFLSVSASVSVSVSVSDVSFLLIMYDDSSLKLTNDKDRICAKHAINAHINIASNKLKYTHKHNNNTNDDFRQTDMSIVTQTTAAKNIKKQEEPNGTQEAARGSERARSSKMQMRRELRPMRHALAHTSNETRDALAAARCDAIDGALERLELDGQTDHRIDL